MTPQHSVEISVEDERWNAIDLQTIATKALSAAVEGAGLSGSFSISLLATSDARIAELNGAFRGKAGATNVLSWPTEDLAAATGGNRPRNPTDPELGDIALAYETCREEAAAFDLDLHDHVTHLVLHGVLHLLGYDHQNDPDATVMESLEVSALETMGIGNPYS